MVPVQQKCNDFFFYYRFILRSQLRKEVTFKARHPFLYNNEHLSEG